MKYLKWLLIVPIAVFPYLLFLLLYGGMTTERFWATLGAMWLGSLVCAVAVFCAKRLWTARLLALTVMIVKLIHIPAYVMWFLFAMIAFLFGGPVIAFVFDVMAIILSGILGLAAVVRSHETKQLTTQQAVGYGILQFIFCGDIVSAVLVYRVSRKQKEETI